MDDLTVPTKNTILHGQGDTSGHTSAITNTNTHMQWFILITFAVCLLASLSLSIAALIITHNLFTLAIPTPLLLAMRPMIRYLFPQEHPNTKQVS